MNIVLDSSCKLNIQSNSPELNAPFDHVYHTQLPLFVIKKNAQKKHSSAVCFHGIHTLKALTKPNNGIYS
jgi:hypothetical protein